MIYCVCCCLSFVRTKMFMCNGTISSRHYFCLSLCLGQRLQGQYFMVKSEIRQNIEQRLIFLRSLGHQNTCSVLRNMYLFVAIPKE